MKTLCSLVGIGGLLYGVGAADLGAAERYTSLGGVSARLDVSYGVLPPDLDGDFDFDQVITVEAVWQSRLGMTSYRNFGVVWGVGVAGHYQNMDTTNVDAEYMGGSARYHLGLTYGLSHSWHLQAVPYAGVGWGNMDLDLIYRIPGDNFVRADSPSDDSGFGEFGLQFHAIYSNPDSFEFGAGLSFQGRIADYDFTDSIVPFLVHNEQYYISLNVTGGWRF